MLIHKDDLWAGNEKSLQAALDAGEGIQARIRTGQIPEDNDESLLSVVDGVGIIPVHGSLTNTDSPFNRLFGITSYNDIRSALVEAAHNPDVKSVLMDFDTGGGAVSGLADTAKLIHMIDQKVKPVVAYAENAFSAGYWLASSAGSVYANEGSGVGSIGIIAHHVERSKQLEAEGLTVTVVRAGSEKALVNSVEPLTDKARAQLQAKLDVNYKLFASHVAEMRGRSYEYTDTVMAQGKEFMGQAAYEVGLTDGLKSFDQLLSELKSELFIDKSKKLIHNRGNAGRTHAASVDAVENGDPEMKRKKTGLTEQEVAALAAGAALEAAVSETEAEANVEDTAVEAAAEEGVQAEAVAPEGADPVAEVAKNDNALGLLKEQLKAAQDDLLEAKIDARKAGEKLAEIEATVNPLAGIVAKAINNMQVALGGSALDLSGLAPAALLAEHGKMVEQFQSKFKVGGVAAVDAAQEVKKSHVDATHLARVNAARFQKK